MTPEKMQELLARARFKLAASQQEVADALEAQVNEVAAVDIGFPVAPGDDVAEDAAVDVIRDVIDNLSATATTPHHETKQHGVSKDVTLNLQQALARDTVIRGEDCCIIGAAGTGKTTSMRSITRALLDEPARLSSCGEGTKYLHANKPGAVIVAYTRKAVNNIRHAVVEELKPHTITIHKLLEFAPVIYEIEDPLEPGQFKKTMRFEPSRNCANPLPYGLQLLIFEESSMTGVDLYSMVQDALPHPHQEVFLGDIQQLPPIFGSAVLGYKMLSTTVIELTEVYRQALDNPILALAWKILAGDPKAFASQPVETYELTQASGRKVTRKRWPVLEAFNQKKFSDIDGSFVGELVLHPWQKKIGAEDALNTTGQQFVQWIKSGYYNPEEDIILMPFNKAFGTIELNKKIAQHLGVAREAVIHEVIAGFNKYYLAVGDRVLYDKEDAFITSISKNAEYLGKNPAAASTSLDRWGCMQARLTEAEVLAAQAENNSELSEEALENLMASAADNDTRVTASSHDIVIEFAYSGADGVREEMVLSKAAEVNNLLGGYALTIHKAQGSEWDRGFLVFHNSHATMIQRELCYTGPTRFKKFLHIICEPDTFEKGVKSQRITGNTIAEKALWFQGKHDEGSNEAKMAEKQGGPFTVTRYSTANATGRNEQRWSDDDDTEQLSSYSPDLGSVHSDTSGTAPSVLPNPEVAALDNVQAQKPTDPISIMREKLAAIRAASTNRGVK